MKTVLFKTVDSISIQTETKLSKIKKLKNKYFNNSIDANKCRQKRVILEKMLERESELVKTDSMFVLQDFEKFDFVG